MDFLYKDAPLFAACMFVGMSAFLVLGHRLGSRRLQVDPVRFDKGVGAVDGAVFALFGLLLAFTFSGAASRFDHRRDLIVQEANAIGTAYLRIDLLPAAAQPQLRALFRQYGEARLSMYGKFPDLAAVNAEHQRSQALQSEIWKLSVAAASAGGSPAVPSLVLPPLNDMMDITTTRLAALRTHPPAIIFAMLFALGLATSMLAGYGMAASGPRPWLHMLAFAAVTSVTVFVVMDMEYPRRGLIRIDSADSLIQDVVHGMR
jgi:hypothetical protein